MNSILKWLHRNDLLVHVTITMLVFYGIPVTYLSFVNPGLVAPIINSAITGITLIALFFISFRAAVAVTDLIKIAVERADLALTQAAPTVNDKPIKDPIVDYSSPTMLVMETLTKQGGSADVTIVPQPSDVVVPSTPVEKKKRAPRAKTVKKES